jgi:hypothetical protein
MLLLPLLLDERRRILEKMPKSMSSWMTMKLLTDTRTDLDLNQVGLVLVQDGLLPFLGPQQDPACLLIILHGVFLDLPST